MAKSQIIKDLANGVVDTQTALKRTKILLQDLGDDELLNWINCELGGYPEGKEVPDYRVIPGQLYGSYFKGSMAAHMTYTHVPLPLGKMPDDLKKVMLNTEMRTSIAVLVSDIKRVDEEKQNLQKVVPADWYPQIAHYNNDPYMIITSASVILSTSYIKNIISQVESRLLDILVYLEKQFGNLDELDIDVSSKNEDELNGILEHLKTIIYVDNSISIGDGNRIKDTDIITTLNTENE